MKPIVAKRFKPYLFFTEIRLLRCQFRPVPTEWENQVIRAAAKNN